MNYGVRNFQPISIFHTLSVLATRTLNTHKPLIKEVILMGGAVTDAQEEWENASKAVEGEIHNFYSKKDSILTYVYKIAQAMTSSPIGIGKINTTKCVNHNVSDIVSGHMEYKKNLSTILALKKQSPVFSNKDVRGQT